MKRLISAGISGTEKATAGDILRRAAAVIVVILAVILITGCSSVFSAYISGTVYDKKEYDASPGSGELEHVCVYLYSTEEARDADYDSWYHAGSEDGLLPEEHSSPSYFMIEYTDADGDFTFSGFTWNELNPDFGKTADRQEIYFLLYHENYGLQKNLFPEHIYVLSDTDNTLPNMLLDKRMNTTHVSGTVFGENDAELDNVTVQIYVAEDWSYTDGEIDEGSVSWAEEPSQTVVTGADGTYEFDVSFLQKPSHEMNKGTTLARLVFRHTQYVAEHAADSDIVDEGWDVDGDGEDEPYYQIELSNDVPFSAEDIHLARELNSTEVSIEAADAGTREGVPDVDVRIYVAEDWSYTDGEIDAGSVEWPESPSYQGTTGADGVWTVSVEFARKPSSSDNEGTAPIRVVVVKDDAELVESYDPEDAVWEPDPYDEDSGQFFGKTVMDDESYTYEYTIKKTLFEDQELSGYLFSDRYPASDPVDNDVIDRTDDYDEGINGLLVGLYLTDVEPAADSLSDAYDTYTSRTGTNGNGYFTFQNISWTDTDYTGNRSSQAAYVMIDTDNDDLWDQAERITLYADMSGGNYEEIEID